MKLNPEHNFFLNIKFKHFDSYKIKSKNNKLNFYYLFNNIPQ